MSLDPAAAATLGTVRVVGTGLLGTSVGLGLREAGARVLLRDPSPTALALARDLGAGEVDRGDVPPDVVVVAAPPDVTADVVAAQLAEAPAATVTDVASVKGGVLAGLEAAGADLSRYVGGHPMAGLERSGPVAARSDLFLGRPWVLCATAVSKAERVDRVRLLALALGATPLAMDAAEHDAAVALVSHVPQVAASLVAARLRSAPDTAVAVAGQGLRDVTRIAGSDPGLWAQILSANSGPVSVLLREVRSDLDRLIEALDGRPARDGGPLATVARLVADGNAGRDRIPGKHGSAPTRYAVVTALVPDRPGELARLLGDVGAAGVNLEELSLEHAPGQAVGLAALAVLPGVREHLEAALVERGWHVVA